MRAIGWVVLAAIFVFTPIEAKSADLQDAFKAAFGQAPPMMRHANLPKIGNTDLRLEPVVMVHLGGRRFALIVSESFDGGYWAPGDVALVYLDRDATGWQPERVWYEFARTGSFGSPFSSGHKLSSFNFGTMPFFAGESGLCGMGSCNLWYELIVLDPDGPADWGYMPSSGLLLPEYNDIADGSVNGDILTGCGGYEYSSTISAPQAKGDLMRVTYTGWMIPGGNGQKRHDFKISTEVNLHQGSVNFRSGVKLPNCGD
jgi:hypothetical protein